MALTLTSSGQGGVFTLRGGSNGGRFRASVTPPPTLLLDLYPGAAAAYSLRKLRDAYSGAAIRVRRSSDNAETDIGFVNNVLDTASLISFCPTGTGFISIWYDQSGNTRNAIQLTALNQPSIIASGVVNLSNGKPAIFFTRNENDRLTTDGILSGNIARTQIAVYQPTSTHLAAEGGVFGQGNNAVTGTWSSIQTRNFVVTGDPYFAGYAQDLGNGLSSETLVMKIGSFLYNGSTGYLWKNNTQLTSGALTLNTDIAYTTQIGGIGGGTGTSLSTLQGNISECILYLTNQLPNISAINTNINTFYTIY